MSSPKIPKSETALELFALLKSESSHKARAVVGQFESGFTTVEILVAAARRLLRRLRRLPAHLEDRE
jgi:hypothetical protein